MNGANVGRGSSLALRFRDIEGLLTNVGQRVACLLSQAGPDKMNKATKKLHLIYHALWGGAEDSRNTDCIFKRLLDLEKTLSIVHELSIASSVRCKAVESYCEGIQQSANATAIQTALTLEEVLKLKQKAGENELLLSMALPRAREKARLFVRALQNNCLVAIGSSHTATLPGNDILIQTRLLPMHTQLELSSGSLELATLEVGAKRDEWRQAARTLARYLYFVLREDAVQRTKNGLLFSKDDHSRVATLLDVPLASIEDQGDKNIEPMMEVIGKKNNLRELADECLVSINAALEADPEEASTRAGMLALQSWCAGADGPDGRWGQSQFVGLEAGIVALQASLSYMPDKSVLEDLNKRLRLIEHTNSQSEKTSEGQDNVMQHVRNEFELVHSNLSETAEEIERFQSELKTKAESSETRSALDMLKREVHALALDTVRRQQIQVSLSSKLDRRDLHRLSALIANGEVEGMNPSVATKLQSPCFRCLCCDKPLSKATITTHDRDLHSINSRNSSKHVITDKFEKSKQDRTGDAPNDVLLKEHTSLMRKPKAPVK